MQRFHISSLQDDEFTDTFKACLKLKDSRKYRTFYENRLDCVKESCAFHGVDMIRVVRTPLRIEKCLTEEYENPYVE